MKVGDLVWNNYHGLTRFGTVVSKKLREDKWAPDAIQWAHYAVEWHDDEAYEETMGWRKKLSGNDYTLKEYKPYHLNVVSKDRLKAIIEEHEKHLKENIGEEKNEL